MAYNGSQVNIAGIGSHGFPRVSCYGHRGEQVDNGRKWQEMVEKWSKIDFRGYLVGNGFPRVLRHFPTTVSEEPKDVKEEFGGGVCEKTG